MAAEAPLPRKAEVVARALDEHASKLRHFVGARVPADSVDDVLQSAAMRAVERSGSLNDPTRVLAWLYRVHRNVIADTLRKRGSSERMLDRDAVPAAEAAGPAGASCDCSLAQAQRLSPAYAAVLALVDSGDATLAEAAEELGISTNNATVRLHRARKALRKSMLEHCGVQSARDCVDCRCVVDGCCTL